MHAPLWLQRFAACLLATSLLALLGAAGPQQTTAWMQVLPSAPVEEGAGDDFIAAEAEFEEDKQGEDAAGSDEAARDKAQGGVLSPALEVDGLLLAARKSPAHSEQSSAHRSRALGTLHPRGPPRLA